MFQIKLWVKVNIPQRLLCYWAACLCHGLCVVAIYVHITSSITCKVGVSKLHQGGFTKFVIVHKICPGKDNTAPLLVALLCARTAHLTYQKCTVYYVYDVLRHRSSLARYNYCRSPAVVVFYAFWYDAVTRPLGWWTCGNWWLHWLSPRFYVAPMSMGKFQHVSEQCFWNKYQRFQYLETVLIRIYTCRSCRISQVRRQRNVW